MRRGFCGIGIWNFQHDCNVGTLYRTAQSFGVDYVFTIGRKYKQQSSDTGGSGRNLPIFNYPSVDDFLHHLPQNGRLVAIEIAEGGRPLGKFCHPEQAVYVLGSEGATLPRKILDKALVVEIDGGAFCLNVSVSGSVVIYDRFNKMNNYDSICSQQLLSVSRMERQAIPVGVT